MICLVQNMDVYNNDFRVMLQAFYGGERIVVPEVIEANPKLADEVRLVLEADIENKGIELALWETDGYEAYKRIKLQCSRDNGLAAVEPRCGREDLSEPEYDGRQTEGRGCAKAIEAFRIVVPTGGDCLDRNRVRNPMKLELYEKLSEYVGRELPWGCLTGVRPTKIAMSLIESGMAEPDIIDEYKRVYGASRGKAELAVRVAGAEKKIIDSVDEESEYCLYVGIPFCPTRCLYCSFTSYPIAVYSGKVPAYLVALHREMEWTAQAYANKRLISIYVGGGTPSSISAEQTEELCSMIEQTFDLSHVREYTVEAGRPDSITAEKLAVLKKHGVTRISVNPQTMNEETLRLIGRAHTPEQTVTAMRLAREVGFDNINMDLIVGLPGEDVGSVERTLAQIAKLSPESLTVHTLAVKRAANLNLHLDEYRDVMARDADAQLDTVAEVAHSMGLSPYYLYRQKNMAGNLENVGYAVLGTECLYNILIMEERTDIVGVGAGSSTKLITRAGHGGVTEGVRIDRVENCKNVDEYIERLDEMIERKKRAFDR